MHPRRLSINQFTYTLPQEKIAQYPLPERDQSKLLVYRNGTIEDDVFYRLDEHLDKGTLLIFNKTRVVSARLLFQKVTGSYIELFCLEPADIYPDITTAMAQKNSAQWKCLVGGAKKWKGDILSLTLARGEETIALAAKKTDRQSDYFIVEFSWTGGLSFAEILDIAGQVPLPPYLDRKAEASDKERYQTIYAETEGSVAAPTAGLHFTQSLFEKLQQKNIATGFITLHVGAGTFKPVKAAVMEEHDMHAEYIEIKQTTLRMLLEQQQAIVTVGTTSLRTIESIYWLGMKAYVNNETLLHEMQVDQWEPYEYPQPLVEKKEAVTALLQWMQHNKLDTFYTKTKIIMAPGYELKIADGIITNFHQPQSTLLLLVAAVVGEDWKNIYNHALNNNYRFLSFGDGSLLWKKKI